MGAFRRLRDYGRLHSHWGMSYRAVYTNSQGSYRVEGELYELIRRDGRVLFIQLETQRGGLTKNRRSYDPVIKGTYRSFAG